MAQLIYFIVYCRILFNISVAARYIRFGLVVVVIRNKILLRILGEKLAELTAKLCGKGFIVG